MKISLGPGSGAPTSTVAEFDSYLRAAAGAGFDAVSLNPEHLATAVLDGAAGLRRAARMIGDHGLTCTDILSLTIRSQERDEYDSAQRLIEMAQAVAAESLVTVCFTAPTDGVLARLDRIAELAASAGVKLAMEFAPEVAVHSIATALPLVNALGADRVGLTVDTWHFFRGGSTWSELETVPLDAVLVVQFDDALASSGLAVIPETTTRRTWPGAGVFELERFAGTLTARGWDGVVSVEVLSTEWQKLDAESFATNAFSTTRPYWT